MKKASRDDFQILKVIGQGSYGKVMLVRKNTSQRLYAMKELKKVGILANHAAAISYCGRRVLAT